MRKKLSDEEWLAKASALTFKHGERVITFLRRAGLPYISIEDPDFGIFEVPASSFVSRRLRGEYQSHPRRSQGKLVNLTFAEAATLIQEKKPHLTLIEFSLSTKTAKFLDCDHGEFQTIFSYVATDKSDHPERSRLRRTVQSKLLWQEPDYRQKTLDRQRASLASNREAIVSRRNQTFKEKYGADCALQVSEFKAKAVDTTRTRYGVDYYAQSSSFKDWIKHYLKTTGTNLSNGRRRHDNAARYEGKTLGEWAQDLGKAYTTFQSQVKRYGFENARQITKKATGLELALRDILRRHSLDFEEQFKVGNKVADFKIGDLLIESDGIFWHGDLIIKDRLHHYKRRIFFRENGFRSLHFYEDEILDKADIVASIILNRLGQSKRYFARNTSYAVISKQEAKEFFAANHLMGYGSCSFVMALQQENRLLAVMSIKETAKQFEIVRFCTAPGVTVVGGFSKLLSRLNSTKPVSTFVDLRYGEGTYLESLGFSKVSEHVSFGWSDANHKKRYHRMRYPGQTGYAAKCFKIYDCGQRKYVRECSS